MIGIDIGSNFIKVCKILKKRKEEYSILCAMTGSSKDLSVQSSKISALMDKLKITNDSCYIAVGGKEVICRDLFIPAKVSKKNIKKVIALEAGQTTNEDLSHMFTSYTMIKENSEGKNTYFYSACPKNKIMAKLAPVNSCGKLNVLGANLEAFAVANAFNTFGPEYKEKENIILLNIGAINTNVVVLTQKEIAFMQDIDFGGNGVTEEINDSYSISSKLSEEIKRRTELWNDIGYNIKNSLKKCSNHLIESVFRTIEYCITKQFFLAVDRVVVTGGGAALNGIDTFISDILGVPVVKWNPLENIKCEGYANKDYGFYMPVALGLALESEKANV